MSAFPKDSLKLVKWYRWHCTELNVLFNHIKNLSSVIVSTSCQLDTFRKWVSPFRNGLQKVGLWPCLGGVLLIANWCGRAQATVGSPIPEQASLSCSGKLAEQARGRKPASSVPPRGCFSSCLQVPSWIGSLTSLNGLQLLSWSESFSPKLLCQSFVLTSRNQPEHRAMLPAKLGSAIEHPLVSHQPYVLIYYQAMLYAFDRQKVEITCFPKSQYLYFSHKITVNSFLKTSLHL